MKKKQPKTEVKKEIKKEEPAVSQPTGNLVVVDGRLTQDTSQGVVV